MKITIIGSGNIATFFGLKFQQAGHEILMVISQEFSHAQELAVKLDTQFSNSMEAIPSETEVILLAVKDDVVLELLHQYNFKNYLIIHTAGSIALHDIQNYIEKAACIWPMFSINKNYLPVREDIPLVISASNQEAQETAKQLAQALSKALYILNDEQKLAAHIAAVFANNFANHLFSISDDLLSNHDIPLELMIPLMQNTTEKLNYQTPDKLQTGPAYRHDHKTIQKHLDYLKTYPEAQEIYAIITQDILQKYKR